MCAVATTNRRERRILIQHHTVEPIKDVDRHLVNASDGSGVENETFLNKFCIEMENRMGSYMKSYGIFLNIGLSLCLMST